MKAVEKYLKSWAEPEAALARFVDREYERALVVPAYRESATLLDGYRAAADTSFGATLLVLVVNAPEDATDLEHAENQRFFDATLAQLDGARELDSVHRAVLGTVSREKFDVLVVDRASVGKRLPRKQGVGLARKIGGDIALALHAAGAVRSRFMFSTDADATLPEAHFELGELEESLGVGAVLFPFWHAAHVEPAVTRATALYELSLRYYVEGLTFAGSPYAFHTLGSALSVSAEAYAAVRGVPKREAAEDFYLLNKLAKVGAVVRTNRAAVRLASRASNRTPFGTGAAVESMLRGEERAVYAPECFSALESVLAVLARFSEHGDVDGLFADVERSFDPAPRRAVVSILGAADARTALGASLEAKTVPARLRRVHSWFDAFRTLKLVHALRDEAYPSIPIRDALARAPFCPRHVSEDDEGFESLRAAFADREKSRPARLGPCALLRHG